jgi:hypothetical protein
MKRVGRLQRTGHTSTVETPPLLIPRLRLSCGDKPSLIVASISLKYWFFTEGWRRLDRGSIEAATISNVPRTIFGRMSLLGLDRSLVEGGG